MVDTTIFVDQSLETVPTNWTETIDTIPNVDQGTIDVNPIDPIKPIVTNETGGEPSDDTSIWTWVMYIGGAILVLGLIGGAIYVLMQNKDASEFEAE